MTTGKSTARAEATNALETEMGVIVRRMRRAIALRARLVHPELPAASYSMLRTLRESGPHRSSALAELFAIDKGAVSRQVALLERLGFVERSPDPVDGRAQLLTLTDLGESTMADVDRIRRDWFEERLEGWSTDDIRNLARQLARYNAALG